MLNYEEFRKIFNDKIFNQAKPHLIKKVAEHPDRYVGLFRPTKPEAKLLQNLSQSNEIRFGDAFEVAIKEYFISEGWEPLEQKIKAKNGNNLDIDQLLEKNNEVLFIEQKVRDDHDSTKKRGQIRNFESKLETLIDIYGDKLKYGFFYFIDPSLHKNKNYYGPKLQQMGEKWGVNLFVSYGDEMFDELGYLDIWTNIINNLKQWREEIPDIPVLNFDEDAEASAEEIAELPPKYINKLFNDERIVKQILPVLFPEKKTLIILEEDLRRKNTVKATSIADKIRNYIDN
ncbi:MAG: hypothetical protein QM613_06555 [Micrococcaceae bacterium]